MPISSEEILETIKMVQMQGLDVRCVTMGINIADCAASRITSVCSKMRRKVVKTAARLVATADEIESEFGIPIVNKRVTLTPVSLMAGAARESDYFPIAITMERIAKEVGVDLIGGFGALVHKGLTAADKNLIKSISRALPRTERVCASVNVASTNSGINMEAVLLMGEEIKRCAARSKDGVACCRLAVFCNAPGDNPFMAGSFHGPGEPEVVINVGVSGPGVIKDALENLPEDADLGEVAETIKKTAFKITRMGELVGREVSARLGVEFGIVDLSLAPTPAVGDSVARIIELMGLEKFGTHGTTAALALLVDAVKKGGAMASSYVGGLSGAFIPIGEDLVMMDAVRKKALTLDKLEALTSVCSVGLDMVAVPGDTTVETIAAIIADEMAIGMINNKATSVRIIPVPGKKAGEQADFSKVFRGGLAGKTPIIDVNRFASVQFIKRGGRIPAPVKALKN